MKKVLLYRILAITIQEKTKSSYNNNKYEISAPTWNDKLELPDGSYSGSDFNPFLANVPILYLLKTPENIWFSGLFKVY